MSVKETVMQSVVDMKAKYDELKKDGLSADDVAVLFQTSCCELNEICRAIGDTPDERREAYLEGCKEVYERYLVNIDIPLVPKWLEKKGANLLLEWAADAFDDPFLFVEVERAKNEGVKPPSPPSGSPGPVGSSGS